MDLKELKQLIEDEGKVVLVEEGREPVVILSYKEYKKIKGQPSSSAMQLPREKRERPVSTTAPSFSQRETREVSADSLTQDTSPLSEERADDGELTIDDLPV